MFPLFSFEGMIIEDLSSDLLACIDWSDFIRNHFSKEPLECNQTLFAFVESQQTLIDPEEPASIGSWVFCFFLSVGLAE